MTSMALGNVYVLDRRLTNFSKFSGNDLGNAFIALKVAPEFPVDKPAFDYNVWNKDHMRVIGNTLRPEGAEGARVRFGFTTASGKAFEYALIADLARAISQFQDPGLNIEQAIPRFLEELELIDIETRFCDAVDDTATHDSGDNAVTLSGTSQWSDYTNSDPALDVVAGREKIRQDVQRYPNWAWMSPAVYAKLMYHPKILNSIKYTGRSYATVEDLKAIFQIENIVLAAGQKNTAAYGATDSLGDIWGKDFYMVWSDPNPSLLTIPFGWHASRPLEGYPSLRRAVERKYDDVKTMDMWRVRYSKTFHDVAMADGASYLIKSCIA